ncbi:MAG: regulatory iron-sulfur-containing complex subunit RicT [Candidatus Kryptoniota bacterium]
MSDDFSDFSEWIPSGEELTELEDRDFELYIEDIETAFAGEYPGSCGGCTSCASGSNPIGGELENTETALDIVEVGFKFTRSGFYVNELGTSLLLGSHIIVEAESGIDIGKVISVGERIRQKRRSHGIIGQPMRKILRTASDEDMSEAMHNRCVEEDAVPIFKEICKKHFLQMKLAAVEYQFDRSRITFYFTADSRVDFRNLVRDLATIYHTRIELRQIGARDETTKIGGIGICGREVCCMTWMSQIKRVTVDHARFQRVTLTPRRLAGSCGRIKCCILFEMQNYLEARKKFPPENSTVVTAKGNGRIEKVDIFNDRIFLRYPNTGVVEIISLDEMKSYQVQNH